jgi:hypothetical protein
VFRQRPAPESAYVFDSVQVHYLDPQIPQPDSRTLAEATRGRRRYQARINSIGREIRGGTGWGDEALWLAVGDTLPLEVKEIHCHYDSCVESRGEIGDSGWSVADSSIVRLRACRRPRTEVMKGVLKSCTVGYAARVGRTLLRVRGLHGPSDTMPSRTHPERQLERKVVVGRPVAGVEFISPPATVTVGEPFTFRVRAFDRAGRTVSEVPVAISIDLGSHTTGQLSTRADPFLLQEPGRRLVTAAFRGLTDTVTVTVVEKRE